MPISSFFRRTTPCFASLLALAALAITPSHALELQGSTGGGSLSSTLASALLGRVNSKKPTIYKEGWIDLNKDGVKNVYEDPSQPMAKRVEDLLARMNRQEKMGQLWEGPDQAGEEELDLIARGGMGSYPRIPETELRNTLQRAAIEDSRLGIPLIFGSGCNEASTPGYVRPVSLRNGNRMSDQELDEKVRRILETKIASGLFDRPYKKAPATRFAGCKGV